MMKKRFLSLLLAFVLAASLLPVSAFADNSAADRAAAPTAITVEYVGAQKAPDGTLIGKTGDTFQFRAVDQNGNETPVTWKNGSSWAGTLDENGLFTAGTLSSGGSSMLYITATSTLDESVKREERFSLAGYQMSQYNKTPTVALSEDGQTAKTISVSGGYSGSTVWTYEGAEGIARLSEGQDLSKKPSSVKFDALRPGTFTASFTLDFDESMTDTATLTITGVAVEDPAGTQGKTYLTTTAAAPNPTVQLTAYAAADRTVTSWSSGDESVATVDENGLVTARGVGTALITATDSEGGKGGIKVVVQSGETPYFENLQFLTSALSDWKADTFSATKLEYPLTVRAYSTTKLTLQATTLYDSDKYTATAVYPGIDGKERQVEINNGKITYLDDIPFDQFDLTVTLADKKDPDNKTVYTFHVTRPRDNTQTIKSNGAVLQPDGRPLATTTYNGYAEGTMFQLNEDGSLKLGWGDRPSTGVSGTQLWYKCYALDALEKFSLTLTGATAYTHLRYSTDGGTTWNELPQGGGVTGVISFPAKPSEGNATVQVTVNILDDKTYTDNIKDGKDGFAEAEGKTYTITVEQVSASASSAQILTAETAAGDWYPTFSPDAYSYTVILPTGSEMPELKYTAAAGATVKLGSYNAVEQTPDSDGVYTLLLKNTAQTLTVTSADGNIVNSYTFQAKTRTAGGPDRVTDYLCINSQYTNGGYGSNPQGSLYGGMVSLGNFGGYITYYYADGLKDDPNHQYGVDFYVEGNANRDTSTPTKTSFYEPAQVWVSEDGESWYALAGSAHYDDGVDWNYTVTYTKTAAGKTAWTDSRGNSNGGSSYTGPWPNQAVYALNAQAGKDAITLSGIALPARSGDLAVSGQAVDAYPVQWGYADVRVNGTDNPYLDNSNYSVNSSGFDLAWAVDENGLPVDVSEKEFHYVKIQTASNIWHPSFGEKSPEIGSLTRAEAQNAAVGKTALPVGVTITDGAESKLIRFVPGQQVYSLDVGDMKYVSVSVNGAAADDNVYVNNTRLAAGEAAEGIRVTKEAGERLVRVLVQNGEKEPVICLLKLTGNASSSGELIEGVKINAGGSARAAKTTDGTTYHATVGYRIDTVSVIPEAAPDVTVLLNGEPLKDSYALSEGENTFAINAERDGVQHAVTLKVVREAAPAVTGKITVWFTLLGDKKHGGATEEADVHTFRAGNLKTWIESTAYEVNAPATVLDVLTLALDQRYPFVNADGNYISEINGLAEFDNGAKSGWMYMLNNAYPDKGVAEQAVNNGDRIVFHYTDDYTAERASDSWSGSTGKQTAQAEVTIQKGVNGENVARVELPKGAASAVAVIPTAELGSGNVLVRVNDDGSETVIKKAVLENGTAYALVYESCTVKVANRAGTFADTERHWAKVAAEFAASRELFNGTAANIFAPDEAMSRAMLATVLYRLEDATANGSNPFADVQRSTWYTDAVIWANSTAIVNGTGNGFEPDRAITRQELVTMLYRYAKSVGMDTGKTASLSGYADGKDVAGWAEDAMGWAVANGLVNGRTASALAPAGTATRAEAAAIMQRLVGLMVR